MSFKITHFDKQDLDALAKLCLQLGFDVEKPILSKNLDLLKDINIHGLFAARDEATQDFIAFCHCFINPSVNAPLQVYVDTLVVEQSFRKKGIGKALMEQVEKWATARGCHVLALTSGEQRNSAHKFYNQLGFETVRKNILFRKKL